MKKNLEKIFASASIIVAVILIMVLVVTAFGGIKVEDFDNNLVKGLLITLAILYVVLAATALCLMFINNDVLKDVIIRTNNGGSMRVSAKVISKMVKKACAEIEGVKCKKITLIQDDYGVRLKIDAKVVDRNVIETETYMRTLLEDTFFGEFAFKFASIEIKIMTLTPKYKADKEVIEQRVKEKLAEIEAENAVQNAETVSETAPVEPAKAEVKEEVKEVKAEEVKADGEAK